MDPHPRMLASARSIRDRLGLSGVAGPAVWLLLLTVAACLVRTGGLPTAQGTMGRDEARLALAAKGILRTGLPYLPDGFLYTRGLLPAYLDAATFTLFGSSDQAARLSDVVFSSLLGIAVYRLGRLAGGHRPAIAAAIVVAFSPPLVLASREAWLYSTFLFWLTMSLGWLVRDAPGDRLKAGLAALAALFSHELAVLLVPVALVLDVGRAWTAHRHNHRARSASRWERGHPGRFVQSTSAETDDSPSDAASPLATRNSQLAIRPVVLFWLLLLGGVAAVGGLSLLLRAPTLGGSTVEFREYLRPSLDLAGLATSFSILGSWHPWLLPAAVLGVPLSWASVRSLLAGRGIMPSLLMLLAIIAFNSFGLVRRGESRYLLAAIPFLAIVAMVSLDRVGPSVLAVLAGRRSRGEYRRLAQFVLVMLLVAASLDPVRLIADAQSHNVRSTWVQALADRKPADLVVSFAPPLTSHYLGRTDFWVRPDGYVKYVWANRTPLRDVHTGAVVLRSQADVERLLLAPYRGRTAWVVLATDPATESSRAMRELGQYLASLAAETRRPPDGRVVLRLQL